MKATQILNACLNVVALVSVRKHFARSGKSLTIRLAVLAALVGLMEIPSADAVMIDLSGGTAGASGQTVYTAPNGTVVTSSRGTWVDNGASHYYMRYLFNGSTNSTQPTTYWLTSTSAAQAPTILTFALDQSYFLDYVKVFAFTAANRLSNYQLEASSDGSAWSTITPGYINTQSDTLGSSRNHSVFAETNYLRFSLTNTTSLLGAALNEIQLFALTDGTLISTPLSNSTIIVGPASVGETVTSLGAIELSNGGGPDTIVTINGYSIAGPNAADFDVTNFTLAALTDGETALFDISYTASTSGAANATLTFMTNVGDISFALQAAYVPEPTSSMALLGMLGCAACVRKRRRQV